MRTIMEQICAEMRRDIANQTLPPGSPIKQMEIAQHYGVSPIPVREALIRLQSERFIDIVPYKGAFVSTPTLREATELWQIRAALETLAYHWAAPRLSKNELLRLGSLVAQMDRCAKSLNLEWSDETMETYGATVDEFYTQLLDASGKSMLLQSVLLNYRQSQRYMYLFVALVHKLPVPLPTWTEIFNALEAQDLDIAAHMFEQRMKLSIDLFTEEAGLP